MTQSKRKEKYFHKLSVELLRFNFKYNTVNEENFTIKKVRTSEKKRKSRLECNLANTSYLGKLMTCARQGIKNFDFIYYCSLPPKGMEGWFNMQSVMNVTSINKT